MFHKTFTLLFHLALILGLAACGRDINSDPGNYPALTPGDQYLSYYPIPGDKHLVSYDDYDEVIVVIREKPTMGLWAGAGWGISTTKSAASDIDADCTFYPIDDTATTWMGKCDTPTVVGPGYGEEAVSIMLISSNGIKTVSYQEVTP